MPERPLFPDVSLVIGGAKAALINARPSATEHVSKGNYALPFIGWRGQFAEARTALVRHAKRSRLRLAEGDTLHELVRNHYDLELEAGPSYAVGEAILVRKVVDELEARGGSIRAGTVFSVQGDSKQVPPVDAAEYVAAQDVYARPGSPTVTVPIVAVQPGPHANLPQWTSSGQKRLIRVREPLFDQAAKHAFQLVELRAAGGAVGHNDDAVRKAARANWIGRHGPVAGALVAGCLQAPGPQDVVVREDLERGRAIVYVADQRWAYSDRWHEMLLLRLRRQGRIGFGCSVTFGQVLNRLVRVELAVKLRSSGDLASSSAITERLRAALREYFDDRPDWWVWDLAAIRATSTQTDARILGCPHAVVRDAEGRPIAQPTEPKPGEPLIHWWFADDALDVSFMPPA